jgi:NTE family protein
MKKKDVALVLSSGGAKGFIHVGVIHALERNGFNIKSVAGTSMGALIGGLYATGELDTFLEFMDKMDLREMLKYLDISLAAGGMFKGDKIIERIKEIIPDRTIENLKIPYCAIATDIVTGEEKIFTEGKLFDAIRASISIPTVFRPHEVDGHYYVDGGVVNPIPVNRVHREKRDIIVAVSVNAPNSHGELPLPDKKKKEERKIPETLTKILNRAEKLLPKNKSDKIGITNITNKSIGLMINQISELTLKVTPPDIQIDFPRSCYGSFDFYKSKEIIAYGDRVAEEAIQKYLKK